MTDTFVTNETYDWDAVLGRMRKRADEGFPAAWQPEEEGDEVVGILARVSMQAPTAYGPAPVVELETPTGGRVSVWLMHKVLRQSFERERPALGETILIRFLGERRPASGGNAYHDFRVIVDRPNQTGNPDWDEMARRYHDEPADRSSGPAEPPADPAALSGYGDEDDIPF